MVALDPRINPFRPEVAAKYLQGQVEAARFVEGTHHQLVEPVTASGWHIPETFLAPVKARQPDFVAIAEQFLGTPYLWGGKTSLGLDCSGLVQVSLQASGIPCPRDSDLQEMALGKLSSLASLRRGDLIFWKGHVAIARDSENLIHANAHHMMVAIEPAAEAIARIKAAGSEITAVKRVS